MQGSRVKFMNLVDDGAEGCEVCGLNLNVWLINELPDLLCDGIPIWFVEDDGGPADSGHNFVKGVFALSIHESKRIKNKRALFNREWRQVVWQGRLISNRILLLYRLGLLQL